MNNVLVNGSPANAFNAAFPITQASQIVSPTVLQFTISPNPGTPVVTNAWIGVDFYAIVTNGGRGVIVEGNRILNTTFGLYRDTWGTKDVVVRDNYFYNVLAAVYEKMGQVSGGDVNQQPTRVGSTLTQNGALAVFTTSQPHGFPVGMTY